MSVTHESISRKSCDRPLTTSFIVTAFFTYLKKSSSLNLVWILIRMFSNFPFDPEPLVPKTTVVSRKVSLALLGIFQFEERKEGFCLVDKITFLRSLR